MKILLSFFMICLISVNAYGKNGIYFTLEGGYANQLNMPSALTVDAIKHDETTLSALRFGTGYIHEIWRQLGVGVDVAIGRFGKDTYHFQNGHDVIIQSRTLEFSFITQYHFFCLDLLGKIGGLRHNMDVSFLNERETQINPQLSASIAYHLTEHISALLTYSYIFGKDIKDFNSLNNSTPSLNELMLGIRYDFFN